VSFQVDRYSIAKYICLVRRREMGTTAKATEIIEPAILANSRYEDDVSPIAEPKRLLNFPPSLPEYEKTE